MSSWSEAPARGSVLRGASASGARAARMDSDLRSTPFASLHVVDARLTDPHLEEVVDAAARAAAERGREEGRAAGYAAGLAEAAADVAARERQRDAESRAAEQQRDAQLDDALRVLASATEALEAREAVAVAEVEHLVVELALGLARAVLDRELALSADPGAEAIARALALAPEGAAAVARLHPADLAALQEVPSTGRPLQVVADDAVERGGCVVDTAGRRIDAQVGPALARAAEVLR